MVAKQEPASAWETTAFKNSDGIKETVFSDPFEKKVKRTHSPLKKHHIYKVKDGHKGYKTVLTEEVISCFDCSNKKED
jgi:hypothetical protein